jgi:DNA gyrase subunit A
MGRATQGVRLINLSKKNDVIASVCKTMSSELEASLEEDNKEELDQPDREGEDTMNSGSDKTTAEEAPLVDFDDELEPNE